MLMFRVAKHDECQNYVTPKSNSCLTGLDMTIKPSTASAFTPNHTRQRVADLGTFDACEGWCITSAGSYSY